jgi:putative ABC transport system permease protein
VNAFALRNLVRNRMRSLLALLGLAGSTSGVVVLVALSLGARKLARDVAGEAPGIFVMKAESLPHFSKVPARLEEPLRRVPGVTAVDPELWTFAYQVEHQGALLGGATLVGIDPAKHAKLAGGGPYARSLVSGHALDAADKRGALLSERLARRYGKAVGSTIHVLDADFTVTGVFASRSAVFSSVIVAPEEAVRALMELRPSAVSCFFIEGVPGLDMETLRLRVRDAVPRTLGLEAGSTADWSEGGMDFVGGLDAFLGAIGAVAAALGALGVVNTMLMSVRERVHELGVLRATGWTRRCVFRLVVTESALLGAAGGVLGVVLGLAFAWLAAELTPLTPSVPALLVLASFAASVLLGAAGGLYPAIAASRLEPIAAIRG